jgi:hypothetical protein
MVGSGRVDTVSDRMNLAFLVGPAVRLPRIAVLTDLLEGVARELMEVRVEGKLDNPIIRAEMVRSLRKTIETLLSIPRRDTRLR